MSVKSGRKILHGYCLCFGGYPESIVRFRSVLVPQFGKFGSELLVVESDLGPTLVEPAMATDYLGRLHRPVVDEAELDGAFDRHERRFDNHGVVATIQ
jgi:hypothetical protein